MATQYDNIQLEENESSMSIKDFFYLCLAKWRWFVLSLVVVLGVAVLYLLTTPPVYTRSTSLLLKIFDGKPIPDSERLQPRLLMRKTTKVRSK